jgi:hypothetical protein
MRTRPLEEDTGIDALLRNTTNAQELNDLTALGGTEAATLYLRAKEDSRPTALGAHVALFKKDSDFLSLGQFGNQTVSKSQSDLLKRKPVERLTFFTFNPIDQQVVRPVFLQHLCPSCWDKRAGKLRRRSLS